jgi:hypothetical protein
MKKLIVAVIGFKKLSLAGVIIFLWFTHLFAQAPDTLWTKTFGGSNTDHAYAVQETPDSGYIIGGYKYMSPGYNVYLVKIDANGNQLWAKLLGYTCYSLQLTSDGGYIIGGHIHYSYPTINDNFYLLKTDANGNQLWWKDYDFYTYEMGLSVQQTSDEGYILVGWTLPGTGDYAICMVKTDSSGNLLWSKIYNPTSDKEDARSVQQTLDGGYVIAGRRGPGEQIHLLRTDENGDTLWTQTYGGGWGTSVIELSDGDFIVAGFRSINGDDFCLIKTDENGNVLWEKTYGGTGCERAWSVDQTSDNGYIIGGWTDSYGAGNRDFYFVRTDENGDTLWTKTIGGTSWDYGQAVRHTSDGGYIMVGYTASFGAGLDDYYVVKLDADATCIEEALTPAKIESEILSAPSIFKDKICLKLSTTLKSSLKITLYNTYGAAVFTKYYPYTSSYNITLKDEKIAKLAPGVYFLSVLSGKKEIGGIKLIKRP